MFYLCIFIHGKLYHFVSLWQQLLSLLFFIFILMTVPAFGIAINNTKNVARLRKSSVDYTNLIMLYSVFFFVLT